MLVTVEVTGAPQTPGGKLNLLFSVATGAETHLRMYHCSEECLNPAQRF